MLKNPMHPGEVLKELYLVPLDMSAIKLANQLGLPRTRIERLIKGSTGITTDTASRLARYFSTTSQYWLNMQTNYDISVYEDDLSGITPIELQNSNDNEDTGNLKSFA